jgi:hypothetical protein
VQRIVGGFASKGARLVGNDIYFDNGECLCLLKLPPNAKDEQDLIKALGKPGPPEQPAEVLKRLTDADGN